MKARPRFIHILAFCFALSLPGTLARAVTIQVLETFDYPGTGNLTRPQKINDRGDIAGSYVDPSAVVRGFLRSRNGNFSAPIVEPNDTGNSTQGRGLNNGRTICGDYLVSDGTYHAYFLSRGTFTEFDVAGALETAVLGINNLGDFAGNIIAGDGTSQAFVSIGGVLTAFVIPGATGNVCYQLNGTNQAVGYYTDSAGVLHGFLRDSDGTLTFPIDPPGSTSTILFGNNDKNWAVGRYSDSSGVTHGLLFLPPNRFLSYDFPASTFTSLNGINRSGLVCGRYIDASGIEHGFLARVNRTSSNEADTESSGLMPSSGVKPNRRAPVQARFEQPPS